MTSTAEWSVARRIGFRFGIVFGALVVYPFPVGVIPKTDWLEAAMKQPLVWGTSWLAQSVLGLPDPPSAFNGSGDRTFDYVQLLLIALLAAIGAIVWSVADRRRKAYPRLAAGAIVVLRYVLAQAMLSYGIAKILWGQFPALTPYQLEQRVGDMSPMGLVWTFMGYSKPYTVFAGLAEAIGGALLLWRRTATLGALLVIPVMTNVVLLNFCYDVPVKLYSSQLLIMAIVIAAPQLRRLTGAVLGRAAAEVPPRARMSPRWERVRLVAALAMTASIAAGEYLLYSSLPDHSAPPHELYGSWLVDTFAVDGVERPPLTTDADRWQSVIAARRFNPTMMTGQRRGYQMEVDAAARTITLTVEPKTQAKETWRYSRPAPDQLVIDGIHAGRYLHVTLHRAPDRLLVTRGFHWINEVPFNR